MNILVTNDDGIDARGIYELVVALGGIGNVIVMAPLGGAIRGGWVAAPPHKKTPLGSRGVFTQLKTR